MSSPILKSKKQAVGIVRAAVKSGRLIRPDSCSGCGRRVEVHAHHDDYSKPLDVRWLCRRCHALEHASEPEWAVAARVLRGEGKTYEEIGELLGRDTTSVYKRLNPERAKKYNRKSNAKRRSAKREWEREAIRSADRRGSCTKCGGLMGVGVRTDGVCADCRGPSDETMVVGALVERWWAEGVELKEIAQRLGRTIGSVGGMMDRWRGLGFDLPYRRSRGAAAKHSHLS